MEYGKNLDLGSLGAYRSYARGKVHFQAMTWIRYNGYGQEAALPITRALARMPGQDGEILMTVDNVMGMAQVEATKAKMQAVKGKKQAVK